jgi:hypothetical protein
MSNTYRVTALDSLGKYQGTIFEHALAAAATDGTIGALAPELDTIGISAIWLSMIVQISEHSHNASDDAAAQKFVFSISQGSGSYIASAPTLRVLRYVLLFTDIGILEPAALNVLLNFLYTARLGIFIAELYEQSEFSMEHTLSTLNSAGKIIFAVPTVDELRFASKMITNR